MTFRPTTLERAYQLAQSGACRTVSDIKQALQTEGYERIQDSLYGGTITSALRKLCQEHYVLNPDEKAAGSETVAPVSATPS
jgi:virulence-associated protein VapD